MNETTLDNADMTERPPNMLRHYADILNPLFWDASFDTRVDRMFEWACTMVRVTGMRDTGWDSYTESIALLEDLTHLMSLPLPTESFPNSRSTQARLALIAYSHMIEMDVPYELLTNLLRLKLGKKYATEPLAHLNKFRDIKINGVKRTKLVKASPGAKIEAIDEMSQRAGFPDVGVALKDIYNSTIRNAVYHSDYAIHNGSLRLLSDSLYSEKEKAFTPLVSFDQVGEVTSKAFAFHSALLILWKRQRKLFSCFKGKVLPYDDRYKGVIEFTFENDSLNGFRVYWPNGTVGICSRSEDGQTEAVNIQFEPDGSINFLVGILASQPGTFSPCVEAGEEPLYAIVPGTGKRPHWPTDYHAYTI